VKDPGTSAVIVRNRHADMPCVKRVSLSVVETHVCRIVWCQYYNLSFSREGAC